MTEVINDVEKVLIQFLLGFGGQKIIEKSELFKPGETIELEIGTSGECFGRLEFTLEKYPEVDSICELKNSDFSQIFIKRLNEFDLLFIDKGLGPVLHSKGFDPEKQELDISIKSKSDNKNFSFASSCRPCFGRWCWR